MLTGRYVSVNKGRLVMRVQLSVPALRRDRELTRIAEGSGREGSLGIAPEEIPKPT